MATTTTATAATGATVGFTWILPRSAGQRRCCLLLRVRSNVARRTRSGICVGASASSHLLIFWSSCSSAGHHAVLFWATAGLPRIGLKGRAHRLGRVMKS